jgi:predicted Zn-dependent protease
MKKLPLALLFALMLPASLAMAKTYPHDGAKVSITIPDSWKVEPSEDSLTAKAPDETVFLSFIVMEAADVDKAAAELDKELDKVMKNVNVGKGEEMTINGMKAYFAEGSGEVDGNKVDIGVVVIATKSGKILLGLGFGAAGKYDKHQKDITSIFQSIKPI